MVLMMMVLTNAVVYFVAEFSFFALQSEPRARIC